MLELRNITAGYDTGTVLHDVTLVVPDNAVVALLGPNGAGKTTLLRVASGLLRSRSGQMIPRDVACSRPSVWLTTFAYKHRRGWTAPRWTRRPASFPAWASDGRSALAH